MYSNKKISNVLIEDFNHIIDSWIKGLESYDFRSLCNKPSADVWSLGQVYMHLIADTRYYMEQIKICISTDNNALEERSLQAKTIFLNNDFPDEKIEGNPANALMPQPAGKQALILDLMNVKNEMNHLARLISKSTFKGKTKHPGLNYFNADEWLQFAEMHFRHHLRQKKRIDEFLKEQQAWINKFNI